jgi:hypothetical protein
VPEENVERLEEAVDAFARRDHAACRELCDPGIEAVPVDDWPEKQLRGREAVWDFLVASEEPWEPGQYEATEIRAGSEVGLSPRRGKQLRRFRAAVCAAMVAGAIGAAIGAPAATATAQTACTPPAVEGFTVTSLEENGVGCHHARELAIHLIRHGEAPADWTCTVTINRRHVSWDCVNKHFRDHTVGLTYVVH